MYQISILVSTSRNQKKNIYRLWTAGSGLDFFFLAIESCWFSLRFLNSWDNQTQAREIEKLSRHCILLFWEDLILRPHHAKMIDLASFESIIAGKPEKWLHDRLYRQSLEARHPDWIRHTIWYQLERKHVRIIKRWWMKLSEAACVA